MDKGFGEESPGFRISELAKKVINVDGKMWGKDGKPLIARRNVIHNTDVGNKMQSNGSGSPSAVKDAGKQNARSTTFDGPSSGKNTEHEVLNTDIGNKTHKDGSDESKTGDETGKKEADSAGGNNKTGFDGSDSGKDRVHVVHESDKIDTSKASNEVKVPSFASAVMNDKPKAKTNFRKVETTAGPNGAYEAMIPISSVKEVANRLNNSIYGYFIGKRIAFPVVDNYVRNAWGKYGIQKVMMNAKGFYFFKFASSKGVDDVLENGPWMIRTVPIILNKWTPSACLTKENHDLVPVWVKVHDVPITAFTAEGLSVIASKVGNPLRLDAYTSAMCEESWGRSSYARMMVEICAKDELKEQVVVAVPNLEDNGYVCATCRIEYEWRPPLCGECKIFGHSNDACPKQVINQVNKESGKPNADGFQQVKGKNKAKQHNVKPKNKFVYRPVNHSGKPSGGSIKTSNPFEALNKPEASAKVDTVASSSVNAGNLKDDLGKKEMTSADDGREWKATSLYERWKQTDGYEDDDSDDVLDSYDYDMTDFLDSQERQGRRKS